MCHMCIQGEPPEPEPEPATWWQAIPDYRTTCVPMKLPGDSIVCMGRGQTWQRIFDTWSFSSMLSSATTSLLANFLILSFNKTLVAKRFGNDRCRTSFRILCWNLLMCFEGKILDRDWNGCFYEVALVPLFFWIIAPCQNVERMPRKLKDFVLNYSTQ